MNRSLTGRHTIIAVLIAGAAVAAASVVGADEPTPVPSATPGAAAATPTPTKKPIVITDENLQQYAERGSLTTAQPGGQGAASTGGRPVHGGESGSAELGSGLPPVQLPADNSEDEKRRYWRELYERQVKLIEQLGLEIKDLDAAIPGLWNKFYAWDDPAYRDGVIKPELDRSLARRDEVEKQLETERARLPQIMDDARRDGASPGWFRDLPRPTEVLSGTGTEPE